MIEQLFFKLIQVAIGTRNCLSHTPSVDEWGELYAMAKKQSLVGVCFAGVQKLADSEKEDYCGMPEMLYLTWMGMAAKIQQRNDVVNRQCVELQAKLSAGSLRTVIMKGQGNAVIYNDLALLRQSGDIDVYLEGGLDKVLAYAKTIAPTNRVNELEMPVAVFPDTEVEFHYRPFIMRNPFKNRKLQRFFAVEGEKCFENKISLPNGVGEIAVPTATFNLVHQMVHIAHHLYTDGIGFRQLMDYYFVLRTSYENQNENVLRVVRDLGLNRFASALMWVIKTVFVGHDNENENFYPWEPCEKDGRMLLEEILKSGNFGHQDETKADLSNKWKSFWYVNGKTFRFWRFDHWAWFWSPLWRVYHFAWRKAKGFE